MNTCKTCRWWNGEQGVAIYSENGKSCDNPKLNPAQYSSRPVDGAEGIAMSDDTHIETGPDFGCIHHEEK